MRSGQELKNIVLNFLRAIPLIEGDFGPTRE